MPFTPMRSPNYKALPIVVPAGGYTAGNVYKTQDTLGVSLHTKTQNETATLVYECERIVIPKAAGIYFALGEKVFIHPTNLNAVKTASGNFLCGICTKAAATADTSIEVDLRGSAVTAVA